MWYLESKEQQEEYLYYTINNIFTDDEIDNIISVMSNDTKIATTVNEEAEKDVRDSRVAFLSPFNDYEAYYRKVTDAINYVNNTVFKYRLTHLEPLQYTDYDASYKGHYDWHVDHQIGGAQKYDIRKLSFSILLVDPSTYEGGDFQFKLAGKNDHAHEFKKGDMLFFPSCVLHRVTPVTKGSRKSLVGWINGPRWC